MKKAYFEYPVPPNYELREMYDTPYRFSQELRDYTDFIFCHPHHKHNGIYHNLHTNTDANDMLKVAYLIAKYYMEFPNRFGASLDNCTDTMLFRMWRQFVAIHKTLRGVKFDEYMPAKMRLLTIGNGKLFDLLIQEINDDKMIMSGDDMVKVREGKALRESSHGELKEGSKHFEYLCGLE